MYAEYDYYLNQYLFGRPSILDETSFPFYIRKAQQKIAQYTHGNINESAVPDCAKLCCCELAEYLYRRETDRPRAGVASESTGDVSVSYRSDDFDAETAKVAKRIIYDWLADSGLLYGGIA